MRADLSALWRHAILSGRASRQEFWRAHMLQLPMMLIENMKIVAPTSRHTMWPSLVLTLNVMPPSLPWATPVGRQSDDTDRVGWWALVGLFLLLIVPPLGLFMLLAWGALRGTPESKRYDPDVLDAAPSPPRSSTP